MLAQTKNFVTIHAPSPKARELWATVLEIAEILGADTRWSLIGGLMVQLHGFEHGVGARPTMDIDLLGDSRRLPQVTETIARMLVKRGAELAMPPRGDDRLGFRFELDGETIDVLAPDGLRRKPKTIGKHLTLQVPGGTQALLRTEKVLVSLDGKQPVEVRRPSLLGAILIKARVVATKRQGKHASDRQDLIRLLSLVEDPRALAASDRIKKTEKRWLRDVQNPLDFEDAALTNLFSPAAIANAEQAYRLLIR